jgi:hypothetical protein
MILCTRTRETSKRVNGCEPRDPVFLAGSGPGVDTANRIRTILVHFVHDVNGVGHK